MKKIENIKKTTVIVFSLMLFFIASSVIASSVQNNNLITLTPISPDSIYNSCAFKTNTSVSYSSVLLNIKNKYKSIGRGDIIEYTVTYKNVGKSTLGNPILQVIVPKGVVITNTSAGTYAKDTRTLTVKLNNLKKNEGGNLYVQAQVQSTPINTYQMVTTALLVYTNTNKAQENAIAYVLNTPKEINNNSLGAAALFGGVANIGLIGLLLIIILILATILIIDRYFYKPSPVEVIQKTTEKK